MVGVHNKAWEVPEASQRNPRPGDLQLDMTQTVALVRQGDAKW